MANEMMNNPWIKIILDLDTLFIFVSLGLVIANSLNLIKLHQIWKVLVCFFGVFLILGVVEIYLTTWQSRYNQKIVRQTKMRMDRNIKDLESQIEWHNHTLTIVDNHLQRLSAKHDVIHIQETTQHMYVIKDAIIRLQNKIVHQHHLYQNTVKLEQRLDWFN